MFNERSQTQKTNITCCSPRVKVQHRNLQRQEADRWVGRGKLEEMGSCWIDGMF
jgi:hypothetical protein